MPYYMRNFGLIATVVIFLFTYWMMYISAKLLTQTKLITQRQSYEKISVFCFGEGGILVHLSMFLNSFGLCISFLLVYFEIIDGLFKHGFGVEDSSSFWMSKWLHLSFAIIITLPWIFTHNIKKLRFISYISIFSIALLILVNNSYYSFWLFLYF